MMTEKEQNMSLDKRDTEIKELTAKIEQTYRRGYRDGMIVAYQEYVGEDLTKSEMAGLKRWILHGCLFRWMKGAMKDPRYIEPPEFIREADL